MQTGIYKITNKINNMSYIGQSIQIEQRWKDHRYNMTHDAETTPLYIAAKTYGIDNFSFEILEICKKEELNEKEIYYIQLYNTYYQGYNQTLGGNLPPYTGKSTCQWDLQGHLIKKWPSGMAAATALGVNRNSIYEVIKGVRKTCCGCMWTREEDNITPTFEPYKGGQKIAIVQYDLDGNKIAEFESIKDAAIKLGYSNATNIQYAISGKTKTAYGFQWRKVGEEAPSPRKIKQPTHKLYQYDLDGNFIKEWDSAQEASLWLGCNKAYLYSKKWENERTIAKGYEWRRKKD